MIIWLLVALGVVPVLADSDGMIKTGQRAEMRKMYSIDPLYAFEVEGKNGMAAFLQKQGVTSLSPEQLTENGRDAFLLSASREIHEEVTAALLRFQRGRHYSEAFEAPMHVNPGASEMLEKQWKMPAMFFEGDSYKVPGNARNLDVKERLIRYGIAFSEGSKAEYNAIKEILTVVNRADNVQHVDNVVKEFLRKSDARGTKYGPVSAKGNGQLSKPPFMRAMEKVKIKKFNKKADLFVFCSLHGISEAKKDYADEVLDALQKIDDDRVAVAIVLKSKKDLAYIRKKKCKHPVVRWQTLIKSEIGCRFPDPFLRFDVMRVLNVHGGLVNGGRGILSGVHMLPEYMSSDYSSGK